MSLNIVIDKDKNLPIYKQIAEEVLKAIAGGRIEQGYKLPTVQALSEEMGISKGTIKHAYEYLEYMGAIEVTQGKGSFVLGTEELSMGRKERAIRLIDQLLDELAAMGFTPKEMGIFMKLKLEELAEDFDRVKVAIVDCNPESIKLIERQLERIECVDSACFPLEALGQMAEKLNKEYDLVLTTSTHFEEVESVIRQVDRIVVVAMRPTNKTMVSLARLEDHASVGIACASGNFAKLVRKSCEELAQWSERIPAHYVGNSEQLRSFLQDKNIVIVPEGFDGFISEKEQQFMKDFQDNGGVLLHYDYMIDRGSFLYVTEQIKRTLNKKRSL